MKLQPLIHSRTALALAFGTVLAASIVTVRARADEWDKKTILTVSQPIQVKDTYLEPGQYVFKLLNSSSDRHIVQIFNADESHIINTILAIPKERMNATGDSQFLFYETPPGTARAMRAWFFPGDLIGQEFTYPKHLREVAMNTTTATADRAEETTTTQATTPQPQAMTEEKHEETQQPVETAQSTPPPPPPAEQAPAPTPAPTENNEANRELPKTASQYPLIGLCGLALIGLSGLLRLKRS
jgi:hypothetical protein